MTPEEIKEFLNKNNISYVYWGWYESDLGKRQTYGDILTPIYEREDITVYKVIK